MQNIQIRSQLTITALIFFHLHLLACSAVHRWSRVLKVQQQYEIVFQIFIQHVYVNRLDRLLIHTLFLDVTFQICPFLGKLHKIYYKNLT